MYYLNGLEEVAMERVEELRRQGDHARLLRTLPRSEGFMERRARMIVRGFARLTDRFAARLTLWKDCWEAPADVEHRRAGAAVTPERHVA